jgi:hypothetical protein
LLGLRNHVTKSWRPVKSWPPAEAEEFAKRVVAVEALRKAYRQKEADRKKAEADRRKDPLAYTPAEAAATTPAAGSRSSSEQLQRDQFLIDFLSPHGKVNIIDITPPETPAKKAKKSTATTPDKNLVHEATGSVPVLTEAEKAERHARWFESLSETEKFSVYSADLHSKTFDEVSQAEAKREQKKAEKEEAARKKAEAARKRELELRAKKPEDQFGFVAGEEPESPTLKSFRASRV